MANADWNEMALSRDEQRQQKRLAVLRTGARLFNERGFDRTSLDDIAGALNVSKRTLYYYVKNKDDILFECNRMAIEFMQETLETNSSSDIPPLDRISAIMMNYMELLSNEFGSCLVLSRDRILSEENQAILKEGRKHLDLTIRKLIQEGIDDGSIAPCDPKLTAAAIFGAFNWVPYWQKSGDAETYAQVAEHYLAVFLNGLKKRP